MLLVVVLLPRRGCLRHCSRTTVKTRSCYAPQKPDDHTGNLHSPQSTLLHFGGGSASPSDCFNPRRLPRVIRVIDKVHYVELTTRP